MSTGTVIYQKNQLFFLLKQEAIKMSVIYLYIGSKQSSNLARNVKKIGLILVFNH